MDFVCFKWLYLLEAVYSGYIYSSLCSKVIQKRSTAGPSCLIRLFSINNSVFLLENGGL